MCQYQQIKQFKGASPGTGAVRAASKRGLACATSCSPKPFLDTYGELDQPGFLPIRCDTQGLREFNRGGSAALWVQVPSWTHSADKFRHSFYTTLQSTSNSLLLMLGGDFILSSVFNVYCVLEEKKFPRANYSQICLALIKLLEAGPDWASTEISYRH